MSSCQRLQIQRPMSQAPRDPSTTASTMVATPLSTATQREDLNLNALSLLQGQMSKKIQSGYFKLQLQVKDVS